MKSKTSIVVAGSRGKMGMTILGLAEKDPVFRVAGGFDKGDSPGEAIIPGAVIIDFTHHTATVQNIPLALQNRCPMVIGTTGFTEGEKKKIVQASRRIPIVQTPNMSVGVNLFFSLCQTVAKVLSEGYDVEIIEKHHRHKKDAPSGTAVRIAEVIAAARKLDLKKAARHGRHGDVGARTRDEIGIHAVRGGDYVGEHVVLFASEGDVVELTHRASSRDIFAVGALRAARWVSSARPGLYDMQDVLGL